MCQLGTYESESRQLPSSRRVYATRLSTFLPAGPESIRSCRPSSLRLLVALSVHVFLGTARAFTRVTNFYAHPSIRWTLHCLIWTSACGLRIRYGYVLNEQRAGRGTKQACSRVLAQSAGHGRLSVVMCGRLCNIPIPSFLSSPTTMVFSACSDRRNDTSADIAKYACLSCVRPSTLSPAKRFSFIVCSRLPNPSTTGG